MDCIDDNLAGRTVYQLNQVNVSLGGARGILLFLSYKQSIICVYVGLKLSD